jgi:soluble lytic murein transglycosylase
MVSIEMMKAKVGPTCSRVLRDCSMALWLCVLAQLPAQAAVEKTVDRALAEPILDAREAFRKRDRARLAALREAAVSERHPLAPWVAYWDANVRLSELQQPDLERFYAQFKDSYVEDRLRNDWLLELGHRRDWANFALDFPRFRMNDDREVTCYALITDHLAGRNVREDARKAWFAQRDADEGCAQMATLLIDAGVLKTADAWRKARLAVDANKPRAVMQTVGLASKTSDKALQALLDAPARYLAHKATASDRDSAELATLALVRLAATDTEAAADALKSRWEHDLPDDLAAWAWAATAKQSAMRLSDDAPDQFQRAERAAGLAASAGVKRRGPSRLLPDASQADWPDDTLAWKARAALRANQGAGRWQQVVQAVNAMSPTEQRDATWVYWKARGLQALSVDSQDGEGLRALSREMLGSIAGQPHFYGKLASEQIGQPIRLPPSPAEPTPAERSAAARSPGLTRAMQMIDIGLRSEGVREWNFSLRGMSDRELLATAQLACDKELWDRCINTSDRTRTEINMQQRFPTPFRQQVLARTQEIGLDPAYVYGLIRQESRFIMDARSGVGASGLMQVMPATARWTAKKIGMPFSPDQITDRDTNIKIGTGYLKLVLDDFAGSQPLAAAAYNAGPSRPRRWREGPPLEPAAWAENIPFSETRDYVKKVLSNTADYAALLRGETVSLKSRLGKVIGPRDTTAADVDKELP